MSEQGANFKPFSSRFISRLARGQRMGPGAYMFVAHRITAVLLVLYLYLHLVLLGSIFSSPGGFDRMMAMTASPFVRLLELGLIWVVLFHAFNGLRLIVVNLAPDVDQRLLAYLVTAASFAIAIASAPLVLGVSL